jgi:16S rRNA (cytosine1402-N4)-methyltransferase
MHFRDADPYDANSTCEGPRHTSEIDSVYVNTECIQLHTPVMLGETLAYLDPHPGEVMVDATLGYGGHAGALAEKISPGGVLIGIDLDLDALQATRQEAGRWNCRSELVQAGFDDLKWVLRNVGIERVDGILADLGVSSPQINQAERGFSFQKPGPLDMRMDRETAPSAEEWLTTAEEGEIRKVLWEYGEEKRAREIARAIVRERGRVPITTTAQLSQVVLSCFPDKARVGGIHPATRTFQAIRIQVNRELERLKGFLEVIPDCLKPGGRVVILAYHSLEDRLIKHAFRAWEGKADPVLSRLPIRGELKGWAKPLAKHVVRPTADEVRRNPRARSARLRAIMRER